MIRPKLSLILCVLSFIVGLAVPASPVNQAQFDSKPPINIQVQTYPSIASPNQRVWIAVTLTLDPGWYIYGNPKGPGTGLPTTLEVTSLPEGIKVEPPRFLPAEKLIDPDLGPEEWVWIYKGKTTIYLPVFLPEKFSPGAHQFNLRLRMGICRKGICIPYQTDLVSPPITVTAPGAPGQIPPAVLKEIERTHAAETSTIRQLDTAIPAAPESTKESGAVGLEEIPELHARPVLPALEVGSLIKAALFALLAGFILNFMPCVLPVVSLKVLGFVQQAQESGRRVFLMGLSFSAGIFVVFLVLAALASFAGYGWGELFQKQGFLITMIALVFAMSLCLFGVFQLPIPHFATNKADSSAQKHGYLESFYKGTLATFLATPCSGPLLGGAMAWTLRQPPVHIFAIFSCLGLGMASPYVVMSAFPSTLRWLPRPGNWLIHFERFMGFALLATVVYLLAILPGPTMAGVVLFCLFLAVGFYVWGQMTTLSDSTQRRIVVRLVAVIVMVVGGWVSLVIVPSAARNTQVVSEQSQLWQPYSDSKLLKAAEEKRWVVVDFTADWCPNCLLVESTALRNRRVVEAFKNHNVLLLKADLTRENPPAKLLLEKLGSRSIPFLAMFPPGENFWQPFFLRDIYRAKDVLAVFRESANN